MLRSVTRDMEDFTLSEREALARHFSNVDAPVFVLTDLPEMVKAALFARYSRSPKTLRRLFLDEFYDARSEAGSGQMGMSRAADLFKRVFLEYGDDSVAQLAGVHVAVEGASNVLTKVIERGRLMSYLEQSTRYVPYNDKPGGRWRYHTPAELTGEQRERFEDACDRAFELYARLFEPLQGYLRSRYPLPEGASAGAYRTSIRAKACDVLRGLLPAATTSNVGIFGSAQAYESLLLRLLSHELAEARATGAAMLTELKKVVPVFIERVEREDRGGVFIDYLRSKALAARKRAASLQRTEQDAPLASAAVTLTGFDPEGETKVAAGILFEHGGFADAEALTLARGLSSDELAQLIAAYAGPRANRRHKPGRAFERTAYRFEVVADYGAFRDLQRHRLLTIEWQPLTPGLGYETPAEILDIGAEPEWRQVMERCADVYGQLRSAASDVVAQYVMPMAYRIRFVMELNAREAMHVIELRTTQQAHASYRRLCLEMHRLIGEQAGHRAIAAAMRFVGADEERLERLAAEQRLAHRRAALSRQQPT